MAQRPTIPQARVPSALAFAGLLLLACAGHKNDRKEIPIVADVPDAGSPAKAPAGSSDPARESLFTVDGKAGRLQISDGGREGAPVVFVHGLGCDIDCWRAQLDHLRPARRAIAYDQRGHGSSARAPDGAYSIEALTDDLEAVVEALGLGKVFLVGHSMSGQVLTSYAARHPERVAGLVYADALGDFHAIPKAEIEAQLAQEKAPGFDRRKAFASTMSDDAKASTRERVLRAFDALDPKAFPALRRSMADFSAGPLLAKYQGPRLAIEAVGNHFPILPSDVLPGVPKTALPHVSHWLMMDDPDGFNRALDPFIGYVHAAHTDDPIPGGGAHGIRFAKGPSCPSW
jgi:pimeloyl-ACP methyl ester carboxylesterase